MDGWFVCVSTCRLIPVRAEAGAVHPLMAGLQHAEYAVDVEEARVRILRASRELEYDGGRWKEGENPYPGLEPCTEARSRVFFGRATDTREVVKRLRTAQPGAALAIVGPSGCGKSSLLNAGVLPALDADHAWLTIVPMTPRVDPIGELARSLASAAVRLGRRMPRVPQQGEAPPTACAGW
jgi:hypothetical protein